MTDIDYFDEGDVRGASQGHGPRYAEAEAPPRIGTLVNWAGAVVSLGLVVGMAVWAFQLTMRDVSGVPVIRALEGPMRVAPADPGGTQAENQGLSVNRIAEGGVAAPVPDRLVLAPPPVDLEQVSLASASVATPLPTPASVNSETQALINRLMAGAEPLGAASAATVPEAVEETGEEAAEGAAPEAPAAAEPAPVVEVARSLHVIPGSVPGVARSLRPTTRPAGVVASAPAAASPADSAAVQDIDAATLPEGTRLVQLGAFDTPEIARTEWDRLTARFPDYFADRARVIQEASSGGSAFYRLRAHGFDDLAASRRFCAALMAQSAPCIPVTVR